MKRTLTIFALICFLGVPNVFGKKKLRPIDYRFEKGETGYLNFFMRNVQYPKISLDSSSYGLSITRVVISPRGEIVKLKIINSIDSVIDNEVILAIKSSAKLWRACDTINHDQVFYIQIAFTFLGVQPSYCLSELPAFKELFLSPVVFTGYSNSPSKKIIVTDETLAEKANTLLGKGDYLGSLPFINDLIRHDPFNKEFYKVRILINSKLNRMDLVDEDNNKINHFAEELSLDDILKN
jgi:hypothetical protein